ncbi:MAG: exo-alpha-sialidase [Herpetosiphonaceae bacterium]|nr:exo-alpha-sialidase [Herpetosiphonaceae bacterium]
MPSDVNSFDQGALKLSVAQFLASVQLKSTVGQQFIANPVATLQAQGVPLPSVDPSLQEAFNQSYLDLITPVGSSMKRSFNWYGTSDSAACWACSITLNTAIWAAITAGTIAAVIATNGAIIGPAIATAGGLTVVEATTVLAGASASLATGSLAGAAASSSIAIILPGFINFVVTGICNLIPNCCTGAEPQDNGMWNNDSQIGNDSTAAQPAFASLPDGSTLMTVYQDNNTSNPWIWYKAASQSGSSFSWGGSTPIMNPNLTTTDKCKTSVGPALVASGGTFYSVYVDGDPNSSTYNLLVYLYSTDKGQTWKGPSAVATAALTQKSPTLAVFNGNLYCAYVANDGMSLEFLNGVAGSDGSVTWSTGQPIGSGSPVVAYQSGVAPGLGFFQNKLVCMYKRPSSTDNGLRYTYSADGTTWSAEAWLPDHLVSCGPALGAVGNMLVCLYIGPDDTNLRYSTSNDGLNWSIEYRCDSNLTSAAPALASVGSSLYALYKGGADEHIYWTSSKS